MQLFKNRKIQKIIMLSTLVLLFLASMNVMVSYITTKKTVKMSIANNSVELAKTIASSLDTDSYKLYLKNPKQNSYYWKIRNYLYNAKENTGALYIYTLRIDNPKVAHIEIVGLPNGRLDNYMGKPSTLPIKQVKKAYYENTSYYTDVINNKRFGEYISAGSPIRDKDDKIIGYLGVDIGTDMLNEIVDRVIKSSISTFIFNVIFILIILTSFIVLQRWYQRELKNVVGETEAAYQTEMHSLFNSVRSLRHDFINHIQVIHGLLKLGNHKKAFEYVDSLSKEVKFVHSLPLKIENPALLILLQTKWVAAQNKKIEISFDVDKDPFQFMNTTDVIKVLSNLIDNAMDAAMTAQEGNRKISVSCKRDKNHYLFEVANTGPAISQTIKKRIFESGFSTKKGENGKQRGQGLSIIKEIVETYKGKILVHSNEKETKFRVFVPIPENER